MGVNALHRTAHPLSDFDASLVDRFNRDRTVKEILMIVNLLEEVKLHTTVYADAASIMNFVNRKLRQLSSQSR